MYLKIGRIKQKEKEYGKITLIKHIGLYKDDGTYVKWIAHDQEIVDKFLNAKIDITIPELEKYIKPHEVEKLLPPTQNLFANIG